MNTSDHTMPVKRETDGVWWLVPTQSFLLAFVLLFFLIIGSRWGGNFSSFSLSSLTTLSAPIVVDVSDTSIASSNETNLGDELVGVEELPSEVDSLLIGVESNQALPVSDLSSNNDEITPSSPQAPLTYRIRRQDKTMSHLLRSLEADDQMRQFLLTKKFKTYKRLRVGDIVYYTKDSLGRLDFLLYPTSTDYYLTVGRDEAGDLWAKEEPPLLKRVRRQAAGEINSSLWDSASGAGLSAMAVAKLIEVLETQIDLHRDTRVGDTFRVVYDEWFDQYGNLRKVGEILAFGYTSWLKRVEPRIINGLWYEAKRGYYNLAGESLQRSFLPSPLKYRRISSRFNPRRFHPVLKKWRPHRGVDYAAPIGEPVRSTADGVVTKVERQRGYGKVIFIRHYDIYTTVYAHLSKFVRGIKKGQSVIQGEVIGYVGQTGLATGPHLHYEFRINNVHKDPLSVIVPRKKPPLTGESLVAFQKIANTLIDSLQAIELSVAIVNEAKDLDDDS